VDHVVAYRSVTPDAADGAGPAVLAGDGPVLLTFTSPSAARHLLEQMGPAALELPAAAIGPVTATAAAALGYRVVAVPDEHTLEGLAAAVRGWWERR
jgi:uroporphyrinogen-III synthase